MGKYFYPAISDKIYEKLGEKYFLIIYPFLLYVLIAGKYLYIFGFDVLVHIALFLLRHKINFLDFYYKNRKISQVFSVILYDKIAEAPFSQDTSATS